MIFDSIKSLVFQESKDPYKLWILAKKAIRRNDRESANRYLDLAVNIAKASENPTNPPISFIKRLSNMDIDIRVQSSAVRSSDPKDGFFVIDKFSKKKGTLYFSNIVGWISEDRFKHEFESFTNGWAAYGYLAEYQKINNECQCGKKFVEWVS